MSVTLIADLSSELSNSYCTLQYANDFWSGDYRTALASQWEELSSIQQTRLLIEACRVIETIRFTIPVTLPQYALHYDMRTQKVLSLNLTRQPVRYMYYQRLQFPRNLDVYYFPLPQDVTPPDNWGIGNTYIPEPVKIAQCLQAGYLMNFNEAALSDQLQGIKMSSTTLGKGDVIIEKEYQNGAMASATRIAPAAIEYLRPFMVKNAGLQRA